MTADKSQVMKYCATFALTALLIVAAVAGFNAIVDPFGMYRAFDREGLNAHKPGIYQRVRLLKAYEVRRIRPAAIVLGTSRSHLALRPSHEGWNDAAQSRYNLAFDGATTKEMYHYLLHAQAVQPLKQVVLGLDTYHATFLPAYTRRDFDAGILDKPESGLGAAPRILADLRLLVSIDTLKASLDTLRTQDGAGPEWFAPDGQRLGEVFFRTVGGTFLSEGPRAYFDEIDRLEVGFQLEGRVPAPGRRARPVADAPPQETSFDYVGRIVDFCRDHEIDLRILITPSHVHQMQIAAATGGWEAMERGKRELVKLLAEDAAAHPGAKPFPLFDFSGYSAVTTEPLPAEGTRAEMEYYWDSSHFKENVGDLVLDRIFDVQRPGRAVPADFGVRLTPDTVEPVLAKIRADQAAYRASHASEIARIDSWVSATLAGGTPSTVANVPAASAQRQESPAAAAAASNG